ncbi:MAG: hypothetical protein KAK04_13345, partial [Cyclobacteriaceae bacterium]|nr:hypothetical protein [Cyclobacteriaceae bacterium]
MVLHNETVFTNARYRLFAVQIIGVDSVWNISTNSPKAEGIEQSYPRIYKLIILNRQFEFHQPQRNPFHVLLGGNCIH